MDMLSITIPFFVGLTSMGCGCSLPLYPGLFAVLGREGGTSRARGLALSLTFSLTIIATLTALGASLAYAGMSASKAAGSSHGVVAMQALSIGSLIKVIGAALYIAIGLIFLLNLECKVTPSVAKLLPSRLGGARGALLGGVIYGAPASIACSIIFLLPFVFTSITSGDVALSIAQFVSFGVGRAMLIVILGMMFSSIHERLAGMILRGTRILARVIGVLLVILGFYFYFYATTSGL